MDPSSGKSRPRKLMRAATIFTGVAACTAGAAQVANAQDRPANAARPAGAINGSIRDASACGFKGSHPNWLHVSTTWYHSPGYTYTSVCFGFKGAYQSPPYTGIRTECGGNNHGFLQGANGGHSVSFFFGPGTTYHGLYWSHLYDVGITSWTGNDGCPIAPDKSGGSG